MLVIISYIRKVKLHHLEIIGSAIAVLGCFIMMYDPKVSRSDGVQVSVMVDLIDIASAFAGAIYFMMNANNTKSLPICLLILFLSIHVFLLDSFLATIQDPNVKIFSFDPVYGCLGFLNTSSPLFTFLGYGIVSTLFG